MVCCTILCNTLQYKLLYCPSLGPRETPGRLPVMRTTERGSEFCSLAYCSGTCSSPLWSPNYRLPSAQAKTILRRKITGENCRYRGPSRGILHRRVSHRRVYHRRVSDRRVSHRRVPHYQETSLLSIPSRDIGSVWWCSIDTQNQLQVRPNHHQYPITVTSRV